MSVEDDLRALERAQRPLSSQIAEVWAEDTLRIMRRSAGIVEEWEREWRDEMQWLRASLESDLLPDWCVEMVIENWRKGQWIVRYPLTSHSSRTQ